MTALRLSPRLSFALAALGVVVAAGCYNPKIGTKLRCNGGFEQECPKGYHCDEGTGFCAKGAPTDAGGVDRVADMKIDLPAEKPAVDVGVDMTVDTGACLKPVTGCMSDTSGGKKCDPVCQTGCQCHEKCASGSTGVLTCNVPYGPRIVKEGKGCTIVNDATAAQTDDCEPGLVCLMGGCGSLCVRYCHDNAGCPGSACTRSTSGGFKYCDVPRVDCDPVRSAGPCPGTSQGCWLSATMVDWTVCDCPGGSQVGENAPCEQSRDCYPGLACVDPTGAASDYRCRRVCSLTSAVNSPCATGNCKALLNSKKFGYCN